MVQIDLQDDYVEEDEPEELIESQENDLFVGGDEGNNEDVEEAGTSRKLRDEDGCVWQQLPLMVFLIGIQIL